MNFNKRIFLHVIPVRVIVSGWKPGNPIFEKQSYSCYWKLIFWLVETIFFFLFQTLLQLIALFFRLVETAFLNNSPSDSFFSRFCFFFHSGWWKRIFWLVETNFFPHFSDAPGSESFLSSVNLLFTKSFILDGETNFLASGNYFVSISQISLPLEAVFPSRGNEYFERISYDVQWQRIFCLMETIFFHSYLFFKQLLQLEEGQYFKKSNFCSSGIFFNEAFIMACGNGFSVNYKPSAFIRSLFMLVGTILEISRKPNLFNFFSF